MKPMPCWTLLAAVAVTALCPGWSPAAESHRATPAETQARVPALDQFHHVIRRMWHDAWPERDAAALRAMLPEIRRDAAAVVQAELPGILREKRTAWSEGVKELESRVAAYAAAAEGTEDRALFDAAERLHAQYEVLVRTIRPPFPELEAFHVVLYTLYHVDLPSGDLAAMRATVQRLKEPTRALRAMDVPESLASRKREFLASRKRLVAAVNTLSSTARSGSRERLERTIRETHSRYQELAQLCD